MKKILITGLVIALIVPQIALASWWNPLSWKIFSRPAEMRVEQSHEVKLENKKVTTTATSTAKISQQKEVIKKENKNLNTYLTAREQSTQAIQNITPVSSLPAQQLTSKVSSSNLGDALSKLQGQLIINFIKTSAPHLANIAGLIKAQFDILQNGRAKCASDYDEMIVVARNRYEYVAGSNEKYIIDLMADKEDCMSGYPQFDQSILQRIEQGVMSLDIIYRKVLANNVSISELNSILEEYNAIEARIYSFNDSIPSLVLRARLPIQIKAPSSASSFSCSFSATGNSYSCRGSSGVSTNCSILPSGDSLNCFSSSGENISCSISPSGNGVNCF